MIEVSVASSKFIKSTKKNYLCKEKHINLYIRISGIIIIHILVA